MKDGKCEPICDENQCSDANACPEFSSCKNKCQGFECTCFAGYTMTNGVCVKDCDENQCLPGQYGQPGACDFPNMICTNLCEGYKCTCEADYEPDEENGGCKPIDPCKGVKCGSLKTCKARIQ